LKSPRIRALLDTNVFIYAFETPKSNSSLIIDALNYGVFEAVVTESVFKEVYRYFRKYYLKKVADDFRVYIFTACGVIFSGQLTEYSAKYVRLINKEDLELLVAAKEFGFKYLVSCDKHFEGVEEHRTPRQFATLLELKACSTDY
jgi:predicted nucleic acid-binding protein